MNDLAVEFLGVTKSYGGPAVIKDFTWKIPKGVSYGLVGRNGAGKSTLLRLAMGMLRPTRGTLSVMGGDPIREAERVKRHVGYLGEDDIYPGGLRAADLIGFYSSCHPTWDHGFAASLVDRFKIPLRRSLAALSKGQRRQVGLLCAIAHRPKLLILDEPGGGLDPVVRRAFLEEIVELLGRENTTVIFSSHHLDEVERIATRVGILHRRNLVLEEDIDRLRERACRVAVRIPEGEALEIRSRLPQCAGARRRGDEWVLTLLIAPSEAPARVALSLGGEVLDVRIATLEDLFVELTVEDE